MAEDPLSGSCHCGAVRFEVATAPTSLATCNCSICRRIGGLWAYYPPDAVTIRSDPATIPYVWGDRMIGIHHCRICGCTTHWQSLLPDPDRMGVNVRMMAGFDLESVPRREIDGASF